MTQTITDRQFNILGYWLFWDDSTSYMVGVRDVYPLTGDGSFYKIELYNLPQNPFRNWDTIKLLRNPLPHPIMTPSTGVLAGDKQHSLIKLWTSPYEQHEKYRVQIKGLLIFKSIADQPQELNYPVYNDIYGKSGITYVPTESHSLNTLYHYRSDWLDIEYKVRLTLVNPFSFSDRKNYDL